MVYPKQGVCKVQGIQAKEIAGQRLEFISLVREEDSATILVPLAKVQAIGLRKVADPDDLRDVFYLLASEFLDPELDWKVRHRLHGDLLTAGGILGIAEVLKALQGLANLRPLPQKERERYNEARHLLVDEISVALGVPPATAEHFIDFALLPPPGTVRPPAKPGLVVELPPRPRPGRYRGAAKPQEEEELAEELELDGLGEEEEELPEEEEELEAEAAEEEEEEAPRAKAAKAKAPRKAAAAKEAKAPKAAKEKKEAKAPAAAKAKAAPKAAPKATAKKSGAAAKTTAGKSGAAAKTTAGKSGEAPKAAAKKSGAATKAAAKKSSAASKAEEGKTQAAASPSAPAAGAEGPAEDGPAPSSRTKKKA